MGGDELGAVDVIPAAVGSSSSPRGVPGNHAGRDGPIFPYELGSLRVKGLFLELVDEFLSRVHSPGREDFEGERERGGGEDEVFYCPPVASKLTVSLLVEAGCLFKGLEEPVGGRGDAQAEAHLHRPVAAPAIFFCVEDDGSSFAGEVVSKRVLGPGYMDRHDAGEEGFPFIVLG